ncbi:hypothetical protein KKC44_03630 [Patescibacteria group bacterium]|nr:hypothetical protein [Patescibacteria group bacterium]MBU2259675.1 hypothetical protein [Patescibacteria group bacterium]
MKARQLTLFDKRAQPPIPPKDERETPDAPWDRGARGIHPYMRQIDLALLVVQRNQGHDVDQQEVMSFAERVRDAQDRSREEAIALLKESTTDSNLSERLRHSIAGILGHETRRTKRRRARR